MITAKEAYDLTRKNRNEEENNLIEIKESQIKKIELKIKKAIDKGEFSIGVSYSECDGIPRSFFENKGYKINTCLPFFDDLQEPVLYISWGVSNE